MGHLIFVFTFFHDQYNDQNCYGHYILNSMGAIGSEEKSINLTDILMCFMPIRILMGSLPLPFYGHFDSKTKTKHMPII